MNKLLTTTAILLLLATSRAQRTLSSSRSIDGSPHHGPRQRSSPCDSRGLEAAAQAASGCSCQRPLRDVSRLGGSSRGRSGVELGPIHPDAMQKDRELACDGGLGPAGADLCAQLQAPSAKRAFMPYSCHQRIRSLEQQAARGTVPGLGDPPGQVDLARRVASWCQPEKGPDIARSPEAFRIVDGGREGQRRNRTHARHSHHPPARVATSSQANQL